MSRLGDEKSTRASVLGVEEVGVGGGDVGGGGVGEGGKNWRPTHMAARSLSILACEDGIGRRRG